MSNNLEEKLDFVIASLSALLPELILIMCLLLVVLLSFRKGLLKASLIIAIFAPIVTLPLILFKDTSEPQFLMNNNFVLDDISKYFKVLFLITFLYSLFIFSREGKKSGEQLSMMLTILIGAFFTASSHNIIVLVLSIEMMSIPAYALTTFSMDRESGKAGLKYFLLGAVASAFMLYGLSLLYGFTGTLDIFSLEFIKGLLVSSPLAVIVACLFTLGGILFKLSVFPMHVWVKDVYLSAPISAVAFFSIVPKIAVLVFFIRFIKSIDSVSLVFIDLNFDWSVFMSFLSLATIFAGNLAALKQKDVVGMMAFSSVAHMGYLLVGLIPVSQYGFQATSFYVGAYLLMNMAVFHMLQVFKRGGLSLQYDAFRGWGRKNIYWVVIVVFLMLALTGLPPTGGFTAKLMIFSALYDSYLTASKPIIIWVILFGLLNVAISLYYYIRLPYIMLIKEPQGPVLKFKSKKADIFVISGTTLALILLFFKPNWLLEIINNVNFVF